VAVRKAAMQVINLKRGGSYMEDSRYGEERNLNVGMKKEARKKGVYRSADP
jgi:hypothetical protein